MSVLSRAFRKLRDVHAGFGASGLARYVRRALPERLPLHPDHVAWDPGHLQIEISGKCNLKCPFCPRTFSTLGWTNLPFATYRGIVESVPALWSVNLQGFGEPLLHPELAEIVRWTRARGIEVGFASNGTLLDEGRARALLAAGLSWLNLSLDGSTRETYERLRVGADFDAVLGNAARMARLNREAGSPLRLALVYVAMRSNLDEVPGFFDLAERVGIPRVFLAPVLDLTIEVPAERLDAADRERLRRAAAAGRERGLEVDLGVFGDRVLPGQLPCEWPWNKMYITAEGKATPCCIEDREAVGDVARDGVPAVWRGEEYARLRAGLSAGAPHAICRRHCFVEGT